MQLSKSDYLLYLKHPAWLWLKKNEPKKLPPYDAATQAIFAAGFRFETYAEKLFPDGVKLNWDGYKEYLSLPGRTKLVIESGAKTIFQGRFEAGELTCIFDVIQFVDENMIDLYEIKSSTGPRVYHEHDLAFQTIVIEDSGYQVRNIMVAHVNKDFVRQGEVKPEDITTVTDITEAVKKRIPAARENIAEALRTAKLDKMPDISPAHCGLSATPDWIEIYKLLTGIKSGDGSIYDIYNPSATLIGKLEKAGYTKIAEVPDDFAGLSDKQSWQIKALKQNKALINKENIKQFLATIEYPIYFLDYETMGSVIPYFDGHKPFQQVPFQYSLHIIDSPGAEVRHLEYLHKDNSNPVLPLSQSLAEYIGKKGTVLVWWEDFEKGCNRDMGEMLPEFHTFYHNLNERIIDLITPFIEFDYVDARFGGSASIKHVLPVLIPELSHKDLEISEGLAAQRLWMGAVLDGNNPDEKEKILKDLWDYCGLDTLAMVKIWEFLGKIQ